MSGTADCRLTQTQVKTMKREIERRINEYAAQYNKLLREVGGFLDYVEKKHPDTIWYARERLMAAGIKTTMQRNALRSYLGSINNDRTS